MERLLDDEEVKEFLRDLSIARMAGKKAAPKKVDVDKAWKKFSNGSYTNRMKIAASVIGIIFFLSGVAFAAVQNGWIRFSASEKAVDNNAVTEQIVKPKPLANESLKAMTSESKDSLDMKPVVFDNAELGTILTQMAYFYHVKVEYVNANTQHVRLFFNWNKTKSLEQNLEILNAFDRIQIEFADGTLMVK